jgi:ribonuclease BN (tRNA processing enzyme)
MSLQFTVLGCATPYPAVGNPCSGYLVTAGGARIWMDAGTGTLGELQRYVRLDEVDAIWISHLHADHCADLLTAYYGALYADVTLRAPIPLYGPPGIADRLAGFLTNGPTRSPIESAFEINELYDGHEATVGAVRLTTRAVEHGMPAYAVRVEASDRSLVYSGDTAPCSNLTELATDCDVLLCEADTPIADPAHHTPEQAGETAATARAARLIVTHIGRSLTGAQAAAQAAGRFSGPIEHASPGTTYAV